MPLEQVDGLLGILEQAELDVGLVEDHRDLPRHALHEVLDLVQRQRGRGRVVRVADDHQPRGGVDLLGHRVEVVAVVLVERHLDRPRARRRAEVRVDRERRPRVDELRAGLEQRVAGGEQDVAGAVADRDPVGGHLVAVGELAPQRRVGRVRVAVGARQRGGGGLDHARAAAGTATRWRPAARPAPRARSRRRRDRRGCGGCGRRTPGPWATGYSAVAGAGEVWRQDRRRNGMAG